MKDPQKFGYGFSITYNLMSAVRSAAEEILGWKDAARSAVILAMLAGRSEYATEIPAIHNFMRDFARGNTAKNLDAMYEAGHVTKRRSTFSNLYWASETGRIKAQSLEDFFLGKIDRDNKFVRVPPITEAERIQWITLSRQLLYGDNEPNIAQTSSVVGYVKAFDNHAARVIEAQRAESTMPPPASKMNNNGVAILSVLPGEGQEPYYPWQIQKILYHLDRGSMLRDMRGLLEENLAVRGADKGRGLYTATAAGKERAGELDGLFFKNLGTDQRADWIALSLNMLGIVMPQDEHAALMSAIAQRPIGEPTKKQQAWMSQPK